MAVECARDGIFAIASYAENVGQTIAAGVKIEHHRHVMAPQMMKHHDGVIAILGFGRDGGDLEFGVDFGMDVQNLAGASVVGDKILHESHNLKKQLGSLSV